MTGKAAALQGGLAALGLLAANFTWQREPERAPGEVNVVDVTKNDLRAVHYEDDKVAYDLTRAKENGEDAVWIHFVDKYVPKPDPKNPAPTPPAPLTPPRDLRGTEAALKALDQFAPLRSPRAFGVLDAQKVKELGLEGSTKKLDVTAKGETRHFTIGQPQGTPGGESFMRDAADGRVYVMPRGLLGDLQAAQARLIDRRLHTFTLADFDRVTVTAGGKTRTIVHLNRERNGAAQFAPADKPDKPDQTMNTWHDMVWRTFPMDILGKGEMPKAGAPKVVARVEYFDGKKSIGWEELGKMEGGEPGQSGGGAPEIMARSEHTPSWVTLHSTAQIITDTEKMASGSN
ncbi:MAG TPA: DUF4340 domain-containing protein [Polyangia bacterium]|jgi:hypothetical protein|nr:DUF4340 domain-containing protein [Polyangia bacterium]